MLVTVTQRSEFECSYLMKETKDDYMKNSHYVLNSHNYRIEVTVASYTRDSQDSDKCIITFEKLKSIVDSCLPDGYFIYSVDDDSEEMKNLVRDLKIMGVKVTELYRLSVSAENIVDSIARSISDKLDNEGVQLVEVKLRENPDSVVTWKCI